MILLSGLVLNDTKLVRADSDFFYQTLHVPDYFITETSPCSFGNFRKLSLYNCFMPI